MYGENRKPIARRCCVCGRWVALRVDAEDIARHREGVLAQVAFADRRGAPYLNPGERELFISGVCDDCFRLVCPDPLVSPLEYD